MLKIINFNQSGRVDFTVACSSLVTNPETLLLELIFQKIHESPVLLWSC